MSDYSDKFLKGLAEAFKGELLGELADELLQLRSMSFMRWDIRVNAANGDNTCYLTNTTVLTTPPLFNREYHIDAVEEGTEIDRTELPTTPDREALDQILAETNTPLPRNEDVIEERALTEAIARWDERPIIIDTITQHTGHPHDATP